jgi:prevent-host-death family protein
MKEISVRELHARTGHWLREVRQHGEIQVTSNGKRVAKIIPSEPLQEVPYFARRKELPAFKKATADKKFVGATELTRALSEDREDRY